LVDIHSHVLHSLDDGPKTLDESIAMLQMAAECGTTDLVATPHANLRYRFTPDLIRARLDELAAKSQVRLYAGCDFHLSFDNIEDALANPRKYTIHQKNYLLVEFSDLLIFRNTEEILARLQDAGMIPVITHPERNGLLRQRIEQMQRWVEAGALVQVTAQSLLGNFGRRAADFSRTLLDRGMVQFVASDAHDCERRPPRLDLARAWLTKNYGEAVAESLLVRNPRATLTGDLVQPVITDPAGESRKWYQIWR
jgi:protein-tyrosine phosphatase